MRWLLPCFFLFALCGPLLAEEDCASVVDTEATCPPPWLTGPLLAPSGHVVPIGHVNFEPYLYVRRTIGRYDGHWKTRSAAYSTNVNFEAELQVGIGQEFDAVITPQFFYVTKQGKNATRFGDLPIGVEYQILLAKNHEWYPDIKVSVTEIFPTGKYQKLSPELLGTDGVGGGSFATVLSMTMQKIFCFYGCHYLSVRWNVNGLFPAPCHVTGFNVYGGGYGTSGKVNPSKVFTSFIGMEYTLTQNWVLALDLMGTTGSHTTFSGNPGTTASGGAATVGGPSFTQFSLAPAIEYNFSASSGLIGGVWFSVAGRHTAEFVTGVIAYNFYY